MSSELVEIKLNNWKEINKSKVILVAKDLEELDDMILGTIPKVFYSFKITKTAMFILVPTEYEKEVRKIVESVAVSHDLNERLRNSGKWNLADLNRGSNKWKL